MILYVILLWRTCYTITIFHTTRYTIMVILYVIYTITIFYPIELYLLDYMQTLHVVVIACMGTVHFPNGDGP